MLRTKSTNIFSEISKFFSENDNSKAINIIMCIAQHLKISEKVLSLESSDNCKFPRLLVFQLLLLFPLFMVKNAFNYTDSILSKVLACKKDVFYRFMENGSINWRKIMYRINMQLIDKIIVRSDSQKSKDPVCLIIDDSDIPKTGMRMEFIGRIFSHVAQATILGFKALFLCRTDGKYRFEGKMISAKELVKLLQTRKAIRYSRRLHCYYGQAEVELAGIMVKLFFCRRTKHSDWNGLLTTNIKLDFFEAYHIYSMRWSIEVFFKEAKNLLGLGKSQSRNFAAQIASISVTVLQYNILGTVKRFTSYETIGRLFNQATDGVIQLSVTERIWGVLQQLVRIIAEAFEINDERVMDTLINRSDTFKHFINLDSLELKQAA